MNPKDTHVTTKAEIAESKAAEEAPSTFQPLTGPVSPRPAPPVTTPGMILPSLGRIVLYSLTQADADAANRKHDVGDGNIARPGQLLPMVIVAVWGENENGAVNGKVLLDGAHTLWVTSRSQVPTSTDDAHRPGHWFVPPRV